MVIPWVGIPLSAVLKRAEPQGKAAFVAFTTLHRPSEMPGQRTGSLEWPYVEGLRMDEAMHPLTILAVGLYGKTLMNQNGAPIRLVVPWKYGFKSIKSIVQIRFVEKQPRTAWSDRQSGRVRLLFERQPERRSSALEPGAREAAAVAVRVLQDADVQRLRRSGRVDVRGDGSAEELLKSNPKSQAPNPNHSQLPNPKVVFGAIGRSWSSHWELGVGSGWDLGFGAWDLTVRRLAKPLVFILALVPLAALIFIVLTGRTSANPAEDILLTTGIWALRFLLVDAGDYAAAPAHRLERPDPVPADARVVRVLLRDACT